jgi:hypothetical protein
MRIANIWHLIGRLNQPAADGFLPLRAFKPSSSDSADRRRSIIQVNLKATFYFCEWIPKDGKFSLTSKAQYKIGYFLHSCIQELIFPYLIKIRSRALRLGLSVLNWIQTSKK